MDIAHAYRNIPVYHTDRLVLGMQWENNVFVDKVLPFGLRSAPKIFCAISDALEWILHTKGVSACLHYIDDFLTFGYPGSNQCDINLHILIQTCQELGLTLGVLKIEGPVAIIIFLGIELNTVLMTMRLPDEKLARLKELIHKWLTRHAAKKRELLSLIGQFVQACKVVIPGRIFLRRMLDLAASRHDLDHWIRLNEGFRSDLIWWDMFMESWNGVSLLKSHIQHPPDVHIFTDASGSWGCGATWHKGWFQSPWSSEWANINIAAKELVPIILTTVLWGKQWQAKHIQFHSDNMAVVHILKTNSSKDATIMHLFRCLHFFCAKHDIRTSTVHIPGVQNVMADALSRKLLPFSFSSLYMLHNLRRSFHNNYGRQ